MLRFIIPAMIAALLLPAQAGAQQREVPYWATIRVDELNMRVGPSERYKIDWVFKREGLPIKVIRVMEGWRLIEDPDGVRGWVVARYLSPEKSVLITGNDAVDIRAGPASDTALRWRAAPGNVGKLGDCEAGWCIVNISGRKGWVMADRIWGDGDP